MLEGMPTLVQLVLEAMSASGRAVPTSREVLKPVLSVPEATSMLALEGPTPEALLTPVLLVRAGMLTLVLVASMQEEMLTLALSGLVVTPALAQLDLGQPGLA